MLGKEDLTLVLKLHTLPYLLITDLFVNGTKICEIC